MVVVCTGVPSVRRKTDLGFGLFVGVPDGDFLCGRVGRFVDTRTRVSVLISGYPVDVVCGWVRSVLQYTGVGSGFFVGTPGGDRLCGIRLVPRHVDTGSVLFVGRGSSERWFGRLVGIRT